MSSEDLSQVLSPPVKRTLSDEVAERLRKTILDGQLTPGEQLRENLLAESLGVSRGPVREAFKRLEREGLIVMRRNRSVFVARLSRHDLDEICSLRRVLELLAIRLACRHATPADLAGLQAVVDTMASYIERGITEQEAAELDLCFHDGVYRISGHQRLTSYWNDLRPQIQVFLLSRNVADADFRDQAVRGHQEILEAIRDRDEARAVMLTEAHLQLGYERVLSSYR